MTIVQLEYLIEVAKHGSFSTAAEHCFVSQPALSTQISNLENELGATLLDRSSKPIVPTETGAAVIEQARAALAAFRGTREVVGEMKGELSGKVRLGVIPTITPYLMPHFIPVFTRRCPGVTLAVDSIRTAELIDALSRDEIDIGILSGGQSEVKISEQELFDDKLYAYVSPEDPLFAKSSVLVEDIDVRRLMIMSAGNCLRNQVLTLCQERKKINAPFDFVNCSLETLINMVDENTGVTIIPGMAIRYIPRERWAQIKPFAKVNARRSITMAVSPTCIRESLIGAVRESVMEVARNNMVLSEYLIV